MINLAAGKCVACRGDEPTLTDSEIEDMLLHVHQWQVKEVDGMKRLEKIFKFKNFAQALEFTNKVGAIAEEENHHPLIVTEWGKVAVVTFPQLMNITLNARGFVHRRSGNFSTSSRVAKAFAQLVNHLRQMSTILL